MTAETAALLLVIGMAPPLTLFPFFFAWLARGVWYRTSTGLAIMISTASLAALVNLTLARQIWGDYPYREQVLLVTFAGIFAGAYLKMGALLYENRGLIRASLARGVRSQRKR